MASEADWKVFRELRELALERFCERILNEVDHLCRDHSRSWHERYKGIWRLLRDRDGALARAFDDPRRSRMLQQLAVIRGLGLLNVQELERFTAGTCETVRVLAGEE